ncbi:hypothetical protein NEOLEDRAFT_1053675 [Neolentinus lepideus HHB14362 ss-1]|uniref:Pre-rRNA-processing protein n=1 Tax=Neolentinus lepideus HHB14362 ss-1 TaxID=1314782 RepID=A0A165W0A4_9AGAM|nr:hypothetical protein NEOLEDRAFT_1053675 [Neolentinus lepideus HHB14362 ss-1]
MPKASKKRKEKAADFKKAKLKLGKGKAQPNNAVDTSFKARSITLPSQSITAQKDEAVPKTSRKLTFDDLLVHLKHYNANTRKDAISGIRELLDSYPRLIETRLNALLTTCARLIGDEDASVRKALLAFFDWLLPRVPSDILGPHASHLLLFTTSAQTHIFPEIRIDAVRFLDIFIDVIPDYIVKGWDESHTDTVTSHGTRVLDGYMGILNAGTKFGQDGSSGSTEATSIASVTLSAASKQAVLKSLAHFLEAAITDSQSSQSRFATSSMSFFSSAFITDVAYDSFDSLLRPSSRFSPLKATEKMWKQDPEDDNDPEGWCYNAFSDNTDITASWNLQDISDASRVAEMMDSAASESESDLSNQLEQHIARALHPTIVSNILDCAPLVLSVNKSGASEVELNLILYIGQIVKILYGALLRDQTLSLVGLQHACEDLQQILGYLAPYFPFREQDTLSKPIIKAQQSFQKLNLVFCEMTAMLLHITQNKQSPSESTRRNGKQIVSQSSLAGSQLQITQVCEYVVQLLQGEPLSANSLGRPVATEVYTSLLQTIWSLLNSSTVDDVAGPPGSLSRVVLQATLDHALKPTVTTRRITIEFIGRLLLLPSVPEYRGAFSVGRSAEEIQKVNEWIAQLPRVLWELRSKDLSSSEIILRLLLRLLQRRSSFFHSEIASYIGSRFIPYFIMFHPSKGEIPGPFQDLPPSSQHIVRKLVLDVTSTIIACSADQAGKLQTAVSKAVAGSEDESYWIGTRAAISSRQPRQSA